MPQDNLSIVARLLNLLVLNQKAKRFIRQGFPMKKSIILIILLAVLPLSDICEAGYLFSHPKGGAFKQQPLDMDVWYYPGDADWSIRAPDKWQHMMGSYASCEVLNLVVDRRLAAGIVFGLGLLKEVEDGYREGWSIRDVMMDAAGVGASLFNNGKYKVWCDWKHDYIQLKLSFTIK